MSTPPINPNSPGAPNKSGLPPEPPKGMFPGSGDLLDPKDPWMSFMTKLFPTANQVDLMMYGKKMKDAMFRWMGDQITKAQKKAKEAAKKLKDALTGND
jgi:hypothetical protein